MEWTLGTVAEAVGGKLTGAAAERPATGISIDTRTLEPGQLFVAVKGERDGHEWVTEALERGAAGALVDRPVKGPAIVVGDTSAALLDLGRAARRRVPGPVIGITGSVGKTSTKDLAAAAVGAGRRVVASAKSFNNELGLPLTLVNAPADAEVAILEMGARGHGHISLLCSIGRPDIGVVTAVAAAHTEMLGGLEGVFRAKSELVESLPGSGTAVLNADDEMVAAMAPRTQARVLTYGTSSAADVTATEVTLDRELRPRFLASTPWGTAEVILSARGLHQVGNSLAALAVAGLVGVDLAAAAGRLADAPLSPWRMELGRSRRGALILNDAYNANPASVAAALRSLAALPASRRVAVLGVMAELGDRHAEDHLAMAALAGELGIEVIAVGTADYGSEPVGADAAAQALAPSLGPGTAVLVKGSRVAGLEKVAERLLEY